MQRQKYDGRDTLASISLVGAIPWIEVDALVVEVIIDFISRKPLLQPLQHRSWSSMAALQCCAVVVSKASLKPSCTAALDVMTASAELWH
jgi:hypothetical protein